MHPESSLINPIFQNYYSKKIDLLDRLDGINEMYNCVSKATTMLYEKNEIDLSWKEDLEE